MKRILVPLVKNIIPLAALVVGPTLYFRDGNLRAAPPTDWLDVSIVTVTPSEYGAEPILTVQRTIKQDFIADWIANVRAIQPGDTTLVVCTANGRSRYTPASRLPTPVTLTWWLQGKPCSLQPGRYILDTAWTIDIAGDVTKVVVSTSPPFVIPTP